MKNRIAFDPTPYMYEPNHPRVQAELTDMPPEAVLARATSSEYAARFQRSIHIEVIAQFGEDSVEAQQAFDEAIVADRRARQWAQLAGRLESGNYLYGTGFNCLDTAAQVEGSRRAESSKDHNAMLNRMNRLTVYGHNAIRNKYDFDPVQISPLLRHIIVNRTGLLD